MIYEIRRLYRTAIARQVARAGTNNSPEIDDLAGAHSSSATSLFGSLNLSIKALLDLHPKDIKPAPARPAREPAAEVQGATPISIEYAIQSLAKARPDDAI